VSGSGSGGTSYVFFTNAQGADNIGVEFEARKSLGGISDALAPMTLFQNVMVMQSQIHLSRTLKRRPRT